jgi:hypothetical protein
MNIVISCLILGVFGFLSVLFVCGTYLHIFTVTNKQKEDAYKKLEKSIDDYQGRMGVASIPTILSSTTIAPVKKSGN